MIENLTLSFKQTFLIESPQNVGKSSGDMIVPLRILIDHYKSERNQLNNRPVHIPVQLKPNLFKMDVGSLIFYWYEDNFNNIILAIQLQKKSLAVEVGAVGKDALYIKKKPFASDLYKEILQDLNTSILFRNDKMLTANAFNKWIRLLDDGYKISVYDSDRPGQSYTRLKTPVEMESFLKTDEKYQKYHFVLSETKEQLGDVMDSFSLRRIREFTNQTDRDS